MNHLLHNSNRKGAALLTVLVAIFILSLMTLELQYTSMVEQRLAHNDLNQLQAYYLAKSGAHIGLLRVVLFARSRRMMKQLKSMAPGIDLAPVMDAVWSMPLPPFPPAKSSMDKLIKSDKDAAEKILEETRVSDGQMIHTISSEGSKINLNFLEIPESQRSQPFQFTRQPANLVEYIAMMLVNIVEGFIKDSENPNEEYPDLRPEELVADIMDWINPGTSRIFGGGSKDTYYEQQIPPYKAKQGKFFTIDELKLVKGIDDRLYRKLKPHLTVYSYDGKINLNQATKDMYRAIYPDFTEDDLKRIAEEKARISNWPSEKAFVDFVVTTLGRSGFKNLYKDEKNYPFSVTNYSFLVESSGMIRKSKITIQKNIKVAVTLTRGKGGQFDPNITDPDKCFKTKGRFWYNGAARCALKPTNKAECASLAGEWKINPASNKYACSITNEGYIEPETDAVAEEPNTVKILYWQET
jgi:type II secretory pathway component PulK